MSQKAGGWGGGLWGLCQWVQLCTWSPNKLRSSNSKCNLWYRSVRYRRRWDGHFRLQHIKETTAPISGLLYSKRFRRLPEYPHYIHLGQRLWLRPCQRPAQGQEGVRLRGGRPRARLPPRPCAVAQHDRPARHSQQSSGWAFINRLDLVTLWTVKELWAFFKYFFYLVLCNRVQRI